MEEDAFLFCEREQELSRKVPGFSLSASMKILRMDVARLDSEVGPWQIVFDLKCHSGFAVELEIFAARDLQLPDMDAGTLDCLMIEDVRSWQREGVRFRVSERDDDDNRQNKDAFLRCFCFRVEARRITESSTGRVLWRRDEDEETRIRDKAAV